MLDKIDNFINIFNAGGDGMVWKEGVLLWASIVCMFRGCYGLLERSSLIVKYDPFSRLEK